MTLFRHFTGQVSTVINTVASAINWWIAEIRDLIPPSIKGLLWKPRALLFFIPAGEKIDVKLEIGKELLKLQSFVLQPSSTQIEDFRSAIQNKIGAALPKGFLDLDDNNLLLLQVNYPLVAEANLGKILLNEFNRITPFKTDDVYWDWTIRARDHQSKRLTIEIAAVRRTLIDSWVATIQKYGAFPIGVRIRDDHKMSEPFFRLLPHNRGLSIWKKDKPNFVLNIALIISILLFCSALIYRPQKQAVALEEHLHKMEPSIEEIQNTKKHLGLLREAMVILEAQAQRPTILATLEELTRMIPDDTWLYDFQLKDDEVRISGFSVDPSKLIGLIDANPLFIDAKFLSPVTTATNGMGQRFNLSFRIRSGGFR